MSTLNPADRLSDDQVTDILADIQKAMPPFWHAMLHRTNCVGETDSSEHFSIKVEPVWTGPGEPSADDYEELHLAAITHGGTYGRCN